VWGMTTQEHQMNEAARKRLPIDLARCVLRHA